MPDSPDEPSIPLLTLHKDIGRLEGRVGALEGAVSEIKGWLTTISRQVTEIHGIISSDKSKATGEKSVLNQLVRFLVWLTGTLGTGLTIWAAVKYGR